MRLPAILDFSAASPLRTALADQRGGSVTLDASSVERIGGLCLQILLAAQKAWRDAGLELRIVNASAHFRSATELMGVQDELNVEAGV